MHFAETNERARLKHRRLVDPDVVDERLGVNGTRRRRDHAFRVGDDAMPRLNAGTEQLQVLTGSSERSLGTDLSDVGLKQQAFRRMIGIVLPGRWNLL